jgi:hypothetical protein
MMQEIKFKGSEKFRAMAQIANALDGLDSEKEYVLTVKEYKKKRSLSANSYAWVLLDKLAERTGIAKTEIYKGLIKEIGGNSDLLVISNDAVQRFCNQWSSNGIGYVTEVMPNEQYPRFSNIRAYYGSSTYDTAQMSRLIDLIVQECKQQGIETMTPQEIAALMEAENEK